MKLANAAYYYVLIPLKHKCSFGFDTTLLMQQFLHLLPFSLSFSVQHYPGGWQDWVKNEQHN